jgi:hypothetical protein
MLYNSGILLQLECMHEHIEDKSIQVNRTPYIPESVTAVLLEPHEQQLIDHMDDIMCKINKIYANCMPDEEKLTGINAIMQKHMKYLYAFRTNMMKYDKKSIMTYDFTKEMFGRLLLSKIVSYAPLLRCALNNSGNSFDITQLRNVQHELHARNACAWDMSYDSNNARCHELHYINAFTENYLQSGCLLLMLYESIREYKRQRQEEIILKKQAALSISTLQQCIDILEPLQADQSKLQQEQKDKLQEGLLQIKNRLFKLQTANYNYINSKDLIELAFTELTIAKNEWLLLKLQVQSSREQRHNHIDVLKQAELKYKDAEVKYDHCVNENYEKYKMYSNLLQSIRSIYTNMQSCNNPLKLLTQSIVPDSEDHNLTNAPDENSTNNTTHNVIVDELFKLREVLDTYSYQCNLMFGGPSGNKTNDSCVDQQRSGITQYTDAMQFGKEYAALHKSYYNWLLAGTYLIDPNMRNAFSDAIHILAENTQDLKNDKDENVTSAQHSVYSKNAAITGSVVLLLAAMLGWLYTHNNPKAIQSTNDPQSAAVPDYAHDPQSDAVPDYAHDPQSDAVPDYAHDPQSDAVPDYAQSTATLTVAPSTTQTVQISKNKEIVDANKEIQHITVRNKKSIPSALSLSKLKA